MPFSPRVIENAARTVTVRWTCHACGRANTGSAVLRAEISRVLSPDETEHRTRRYARQDAEAKLSAMCVCLRRRQDSFSRYRPMHLNCACEECGCREPWATRRPARAWRTDTPKALICLLILGLGVSPALCVISLIHMEYVLSRGLKAADPLFWVCAAFWAAALTAGIAFLVCRTVRNRRLRELPDESFPIIVEKPSGDP